MRGLMHLVWKDFCLGGVLLVIAAAVMVAVAMGVAGANLELETVDRWTAANYWAWLAAIVVPFIAAAGFPAQLVGGETETGTLDWLRTLPVSLPRVIASKVAVTFLMLAAVWLLSWALLLRRSDYLESYFLFGTFQALQVALTAFIFVLLARNTLVSLLLVVPASSAATLAIGRLTIWIEDLPPYFTADRTSPVQIGLLALYCVLLLVILFAVVIPLRFHPRRGSWRLSRIVPEEPVVYWQPTDSVYVRPGTGVFRFGTFGTLLWQQVRQSWGVYLAVLLLFGIAAVVGNIEWLGPVSLLLGIGGLSILGSQSFASDGGRNYQLFLAARGIHPAVAWLTRVLPGAVVALLGLALAAVVLPQQESAESTTVITVCGGLFMFAVAQLWGIWFQRPVVAHFAALAFGVFLLMTLVSGILYLYPTFGWALAIAGVGFLATTLSIADRWLDVRRTWGFHLMLFAGLVGSILIACAAGLAVRLLDRPMNREPAAFAMPAVARETSQGGQVEELPPPLQEFDEITRVWARSEYGSGPRSIELVEDAPTAETRAGLVARVRGEMEPLLDDLLAYDTSEFAPIVATRAEATYKLDMLDKLLVPLSFDAGLSRLGPANISDHDVRTSVKLLCLKLRMVQAVRTSDDLFMQRTADNQEMSALFAMEFLQREYELASEQRQFLHDCLIDAEDRTELRHRALAAWLGKARESLSRGEMADRSLLLTTQEQRVRILYVPGEKSRALSWLNAIAAIEFASAESGRTTGPRGEAWGQLLGISGAGIDEDQYTTWNWLPWTFQPEAQTEHVRRLLRNTN